MDPFPSPASVWGRLALVLTPPTHLCNHPKIPLPRALRLYRTVRKYRLADAQGPDDLGLPAPFQILSEPLIGQPGGCGGVTTGLALGRWIQMRCWAVDRGRNSLSTREPRGTQRGQECQGAGGAQLPKAEQGFFGQESVHSKEGREHKRHQGRNVQGMEGWSVADACVFTASSSGLRSLDFRWYTVRNHWDCKWGERSQTARGKWTRVGVGMELESWQSMKKWLEGGRKELVPRQTGVGSGRPGRHS